MTTPRFDDRTRAANGAAPPEIVRPLLVGSHRLLYEILLSSLCRVFTSTPIDASKQ